MQRKTPLTNTIETLEIKEFDFIANSHQKSWTTTSRRTAQKADGWKTFTGGWHWRRKNFHQLTRSQIPNSCIPIGSNYNTETWESRANIIMAIHKK